MPPAPTPVFSASHAADVRRVLRPYFFVLLLGACGLLSAACTPKTPAPDAAKLPPELPSAASAAEAMAQGRYAEAHDLWRTRANRGDAEAQYNMGWLFHNGYGQAINDQQAVDWWLQAAEQGHLDAHLALANVFRLGGRNLPADPRRALLHLAVAATDDDEALALFKKLSAEEPTELQKVLAEIIRLAPAALGKRRTVGDATVALRSVPDDHLPQDNNRLLPSGAELVTLKRQGEWVEVGVVASGQSGWLKKHDLAAPPQPSSD